MILTDNKQVFNLWNTNGRRADVLNAIEIYLSILMGMREDDPSYVWATYPTSLSQFYFYKSAIEESPEVFKTHGGYDKFIKEVSLEYLEEKGNLTSDQMTNLDKNIEMRARHYTSNLVRLGLATNEREITPVGESYYKDNINRDELEEVLPIDTTNLLILRQLLKFKTYTKPDCEGRRCAYSPLFMALYILLSGYQFSISDFKRMVQSLTPYNPMDPEKVIEMCRAGDYFFEEREVDIPSCFLTQKVVGQDDFEGEIKNYKSGSRVIAYYEFYKKLFDYYQQRTEAKYESLKEVYKDNTDSLNKAFGRGGRALDFGTNFAFSHESFIEANIDNVFLSTENFNETFFTEYFKSKISDQVRENSNTTSSLFSATGLISLGKALPQLKDIDVYECVFNIDYIKDNVFTVATKEEYDLQMTVFENNHSLCKILEMTDDDIENTLSKIAVLLDKDTKDIGAALADRTSVEFLTFVRENYPKDRVLNLLKGFSSIKGGMSARDEINKSCSVPTAYEYIVALAWYYISDDDYNLYESMNLTMGADFEPERFALGGAGDIVVEYEDIIVMIEVTMMNPQNQKRAEWEPVLRHSVNLRVESAPKDTVTFFVANELDYNTINIWRAVAMVPLKASNSDGVVSGVDIMPLTNNELSKIMEDRIGSRKLISAIKESYSKLNHSFDESWRETILNEANLN